MANLNYLLLFLLLSSTAIQAQREIRSFNSAWNFTLAKETGESRKVNLPHTWNGEDPFINGKPVQKDLNLARDYGKIRAVSITYEGRTEGNISIEFTKNSRRSLLSSIKLKKL